MFCATRTLRTRLASPGAFWWDVHKSQHERMYGDVRLYSFFL